MKEKLTLDIAELKNSFRIKYGKLERIDNRFSIPKWKVVESKANNGDGYCRVGFKGKLYRYHVVLWVLHNNENIPEGLEIDHINGDKIDNRIENIRVIQHRANQQNLGVHRYGALTGCYYQKDAKKHRAQIKIYGKQIYLGLFETEHEAHEAYKIACKHVNQYVDNDSFRDIVH